MNSRHKERDGAIFYVIMALIIGLMPVLGLATIVGNSTPVGAQGGQLYQPQSWDTIQGWSQNCQVAFDEGSRVPQRLVLTNNSLSTWSVPAIDLVYDFYDSVEDCIGIDYHVISTYKTASSSTASSTLLNQSYTWWRTGGNGTTYVPSVQNMVYPSGTDCPPSDPAQQHYTQVGPFSIPPNTYLIIYWEAHVAMTLQWQLDPPGCYGPHNGACYFPGASLQTTLHNLGGLKSTQFPVACLDGEICGYKYLDTAPLGTYNAGDTGLEGWTICVSGQMEDGTPLTVCDNTSEDGSYCFIGLNDGTWTVSEQLQSGYVNTSPTSIDLDISEGTAYADENFFNQVAEPQLTIEKSFIDVNGGSIKPGDNICYTINYSNTGTAAADNVTITDDYDPTYVDAVYAISPHESSFSFGHIIWDIGTLGVNDSGSVSYCVLLSDNATFPAGQTDVTNMACIEPTDPDVCDNVTLEVRNIFNLCIDKTWQDENGPPPEPGDIICYNIGYCSPVAVDNVTITDNLTLGLPWIGAITDISDGGTYHGTATTGVITWNIGSFGPGADNVSYCIQLAQPGNFPAGITDVCDTACDNATDVPQICDTECVPVQAEPSLTLQKVFTDVNGGQTVPSDNICYTISYSNNGNAAADNVTITDDPDENWITNDSPYYISDSGSYDGDIITWDIGTLQPGDNGTVSYCVTLKGIGVFPAGDTIVRNNACIEPTDPDLCVRKSVVVRATPIFTVDKQADTNTAFPGDNVTYIIEVCNNGTATDSLLLTDNPDETYIASVDYISDGGSYDGDFITWNIGPLDPGACDNVSYTATFKGSSSFPPGTTPVTNTACADAETTHGGGCDSTTVEVHNNIDLDITKNSTDVNGGDVEPGDIITYTINYVNNGDNPADNVTIQDDPDETYIESISSISNGGTYDGDIITWEIGTVGPGGSGSVSYSATLKSSDSFPTGTTSITNTACIYPTDPVVCASRTLEVTIQQTTTTAPPPVKPKVSPNLGTTGYNNPGQFCVKYTRCKPRIIAGEPVVISTNVINNGYETGAYNVVLKINGNVEQQKVVTVEPSMASPINFTVVKSEPGTYEVSIDNERTSFTVISQETSQKAGPVIAIFGVLITLMFAVVLLLVRRRFQFR
jgi:uncharacterized repeat protein (TIGR01451 family)